MHGYEVGNYGKGGRDKLCSCEKEIGDSWQFDVWLFLHGKRSINGKAEV